MKHKTSSVILTFCALAASAATTAFAQLTAPAAAPAAPAAAGENAARRPRAFPPEAFTTTTNYILVVNHNSAVDAEWLEEHSTYMRSQLSCGVVNVVEDGEIGADARAFIANIRAKHDGNAKMVLVLSNEPGIAPILASPYEYWGIMDAAWGKAGGGDADTINLRTGKRIFQTLGHVIGAGHRAEREAVMRYTPAPADLDDCLSRGFHPMNTGTFNTVQRAIGLDARRLRPAKELVELGLLKPRPAPSPAPAETPAPAPAEARE